MRRAQRHYRRRPTNDDIRKALEAVYDDCPRSAVARTVVCVAAAVVDINGVIDCEARLRKIGGTVRYAHPAWHFDARHLARAAQSGGLAITFGNRNGRGVRLVVQLLQLVGWRRTPAAVWHVLRDL